MNESEEVGAVSLVTISGRVDEMKKLSQVTSGNKETSILTTDHD